MWLKNICCYTESIRYWFLWIIHWKFGRLRKSPHPCIIAVDFCTWNLVLCLHFELKLCSLSSTCNIDLLLIYWHDFFTLQLDKHFCWVDWLCLVIFWSSIEDVGFLKIWFKKYAAKAILHNILPRQFWGWHNSDILHWSERGSHLGNLLAEIKFDEFQKISIRSLASYYSIA